MKVKLSSKDQYIVSIPVVVLKELYEQSKDFSDDYIMSVIVPSEGIKRVEDEILAGRINPEKMETIYHDKRNKKLIDLQEEEK